MTATFCFIDLETTGLEVSEDSILEIGAVLTNERLEPVADFHRVCKYVTPWEQYSDEQGTFMAPIDIVPVVARMHSKSGLWDECRDAEQTVSECIEDLTAWCETIVPIFNYVEGQNPIYITGNTVEFDVNFLVSEGFAWREFFHYRLVNISSPKILSSIWKPELLTATTKPESKKLHRALPDIYDSMMELAYFGEELYDVRLFPEPYAGLVKFAKTIGID